jgi:hypothetical protein
MTGVRGARWTQGQAGVGNARLANAATSQEAWPEVAPKTTKVPLARAGVSPPIFFRSFPFVPFVIAGLDPAIHAGATLARRYPPALAC